MTSLTPSLNRTQKELLIFGYIRKGFDESIPVAINRLCLKFYDEIIYILVRGQKLQQFLSTKRNKSICRGTFKYSPDMSFKYKIYPKGNVGKESTDLMMKPKYDKQQIIRMSFQSVLKCIETGTVTRKCTVDSKCRYINWGREILLLSELRQFESFTFTVSVSIDWVQYRDRIELLNPIPIRLKKHNAFTWTIHQSLNYKLRKMRRGQQYALSGSDSHLQFTLHPKGVLDRNGAVRSESELRVSLSRCPVGFKSILYQWRLTLIGVSGVQFDLDGRSRINCGNGLFIRMPRLKPILKGSSEFILNAFLSVSEVQGWDGGNVDLNRCNVFAD